MIRVYSFASGNLWRWKNSKNRNGLLNYIRKLNVSSVELTFPTKEELFLFKLSNSNKNWLRTLKYVTIHAPFRLFEDSENEKEIIDQINHISNIYNALNCKNVIIHPENDLFTSNLLVDCGFEVSIENLPKKYNVPIPKLKEVLKKHSKIKICVDVSHAYSWSKFETGKLIDVFHDRISQIHVSGSYRKKDHQSMRKISKEFQFSIQPIKQLNVPVVIEEDIAIRSLDYVKEEIEFIKYFLTA